MTLTQAQIITLKKLTGLSGEKTVSIENVLDSLDSVVRADTGNISATTRSGQSTMTLRDDHIIPSVIPPESLLGCS